MSSNNNVINIKDYNFCNINHGQKLFNYEDAKKASQIFKELVDKGDNEAYVYLGALYEFGGNNLEIDYVKSKYYYEKSIELVGAVEAYYGLARLYYYGKGVSKDYEESLYIYKKVYNEYEDSFSPYLIGKMYLYGYGVDKDVLMAEKYLRVSAKEVIYLH